MNKKVRKCSKCGIEIIIVDEKDPLKHICTECGGRGKRSGRDSRTSRRKKYVREGKKFK